MNTIAKSKNQTGCRAVLELNVNNHTGVMSHVAGLFSRRAYNIEGILCMPVGSGEISRIWLLVNDDERLEQMMKQVAKLEDIYEVRRHEGNHAVFKNLGTFFN